MKLDHYSIYNVKIHKWYKNGPEIKTIPFSERGDHIEFKYFIRNKFRLF